MNDPSPTSPNGWLELAVTLAIQAIASLALLTLPAVAPLVGVAVGLPASLIGLFIGLVYVGAIFGSLAAGAVVDRWGPVRISQFGLICGAVGLALCCTGSPAAMAGGAVIMGIGYGPITPASSHLLIRNTPVHRLSLMFSLKQTGVPLGGMLAGAFAPALVLAVGWRGGLLCIAATCLGCAALAQPLRQRLDKDRNTGAAIALNRLAEPVRLVAGDRGLRSLAVCSLFFSAVQLTVTTYTVIYLHTELGYGLVAAGLALSVCQLAGMAGRVIWGHVADGRLGTLRTLALLAAATAACCIATSQLTAGTPWLVVMALLAVLGATAIGWNGVFLAEVARQAPSGLASLATGGTSAITFLGVVAVPPLFAWLASATGSYRTGYVALAVVLGWCFFQLIRLHRMALRAA
ncbi:MAG: major facilitator superfamily 1 [Polaromonas sp.]|nr:major facilitator superfamily 1 [Polaromonas sp.]